jgi:hypothetical protein
MDYTRPQLTEPELIQARMDAAKLIRKAGMKNLPLMFGNLCVENIRLVKEINEHRTARGIPPLEVHKV